MAFDGIVVANLADELNRALTGGRISKIAQPEPDEIYFTVKNRKDTYRLRLCASASLPLVYLTQSNPMSPLAAPNFCMVLRKHAANAKILGVSQPGLERVLRFDLEHLDEMGDLCKKSLYMEIMGKHSNLIFCDENNVIIDSIKRVNAAVSSVREVLPGRPYFIPNTLHKLNPLEASRDEIVSCLNGPEDAASSLMKHFTGISRPTALEAVSRSHTDADLPCSELPEEMRHHLADTFCSMMDDVKEGRFSPCIAFDGKEPHEFASVLLTGWQDCEVRQYDTVSEVLETYYASRSQISRMKQKSYQLRHLVQTHLERDSKKYDLQLRQLADTEKREKYRIYGEMLNTYGYSCRPGDKELHCVNYYTSEPMTVPLDPTMSASENAQKYFERYNKLKRTSEALNELTVATKEEIEHLESVLISIDLAQSDADLDEIRRELSECGYAKSHTKGGRKDTRQKSQPYHYRSSDGFDIYVGKNNLQNDYLTFKFAQGNDIWMHAKKAHGSHVIIKTDGKEVPDRTYEEAGGLAAYYSQARQAPKAEVDYIERKFVKKPAGAKPGYVIYHTNYSLISIPSIEGLKCISD